MDLRVTNKPLLTSRLFHVLRAVKPMLVQVPSGTPRLSWAGPPALDHTQKSFENRSKLHQPGNLSCSYRCILCKAGKGWDTARPLEESPRPFGPGIPEESPKESPGPSGPGVQKVSETVSEESPVGDSSKGRAVSQGKGLQKPNF